MMSFTKYSYAFGFALASAAMLSCAGDAKDPFGGGASNGTGGDGTLTTGGAGGAGTAGSGAGGTAGTVASGASGTATGPGGSTGSGATGTAGSGGATSGTGGSLDGGLGGAGQPPSDAGCQFSDLLTATQFQSLFPNIKPPYTYAGLVSAAERYYKEFTCTGDLEMRKREAAAFLANIAHETAGLVYAEEVACAGKCLTTTACQVYVRNGICYDGRGAIQLSFYQNYQAASKALGTDLLAHPELVATDPELAIATAIWFWQDQGKCHNAIVDGAGFGTTVNAINGIECTSTDPTRIAQWQDRLSWFNRITQAMGTVPGDTTGCR